MPELLIGYGAADDLAFTEPDYTLPHFFGNVRLSDQADYSGILDTYSTLTEPGALGTDDQESRAIMDVAGFNPPMEAIDDLAQGPYYISTKARQTTAAVDLPAAPVNLRAYLVAVRRSTWGIGLVPTLYAYDPAGETLATAQNSTGTGSVGTEWGRQEIRTLGISAASWPTWRTALAARLTTMTVAPLFWVGEPGTYEVAFLGLRLTWDELGGRMPPLRQVQRGDGLGSSVPRAVQSNSRQASLRSSRAFI